MKKYLTLLFALSMFSVAAEAKNGAYIGADILRAQIKNTYHVTNSSDLSFLTYKEGTTSKDTSTGFSISAGYRFDTALKDVFVAPEIFYDHINTRSPDYYSNENPNSIQDHMGVDNRFGAKLNLGYDITSKFSAFVNAGLAYDRYAVRWPSVGQSRVIYKPAMIYGLGLSYKMTDSISIRTSYDRQSFNVQNINEGERTSVKLQVLKVGLVYNF